MPSAAKRRRRPQRDAPHPTALKILDVAERLFANRGITETSLRDIESGAEVNNAAIYYHFGNKDDLVCAVFGRLAGPLAEERLRMLDACGIGRGRPPMIEQIIAAFFTPVLSMGDGSAEARLHFIRLRTQLTPEKGELARELVERHFGETSRRFLAAFGQALPELSLEEIEWRFHMMMGALGSTICSPARFQAMGRSEGTGHYDPRDYAKALPRLIHLISGMFRLPACDAETRLNRMKPE